MPISPNDRDVLSSLSSASTDAQVLTAVNTIREHYPAEAEVAALLATVLAASGEFLRPSGDFTADVASTGGSTSLSTLLTPLFLLAAGAIVPKLGVVGRPAGGIDCLVQIPGYQASLPKQRVEQILGASGYAHFLAEEDFAPLDGRMFHLRHRHAAQSIPSLVTASLLSKKLAVGIRFAGLDVRVAPHGNFGTSWSQAADNSRLFIRTAKLLSIEASPVLTDARFPYQPFIGRCEALVALHELFNFTSCTWLEGHLVTCRNLALACTPESFRAGIANVSRAEMQRDFNQNLIAQGSSPEAFENVVRMTKEQHVHELRAVRAGFAVFPVESIRDCLVAWQKQAEQSGRRFPDPVGIILRRRAGEWVNRGELMATVRIVNGRKDEVLHDLAGLMCMPAACASALGMEAIAVNG